MAKYVLGCTPMGNLICYFPEDIQGYCLQDIYEGITWKKTFGGCFDVQRCPTDTGGKHFLISFIPECFIVYTMKY